MGRLLPSALFAGCCLVSCGQQPDGYNFEGAEFERREQVVEVIEHRSLKELRETAPEGTFTEGRELMGYSYLRPDGCEIHVTSLQKASARSWLGHEMTHCVYGRWHK